MTTGHNASQEFKNQYNELVINTFDFSFDRWHEQNVWDRDYECYSIIENGIMIANISVFKMNLLIDGLQHDFLQIGAVATKKEYRNKGYSRQIMNHIFNIYPDTPAFLFGSDSVLEFYPKFGFSPTIDRKPYIECTLENECEMTRLEVTNPKVDKYLKERSQFSKVFDCTNQYSINWFHLLYGFSNNIYEIPELDVMIVAKQYDNTLEIYDVVANKPVSFSKLIPHLSFKGVNLIQFGFNPDWLNVDYCMKEYKIEDSTLFLKGNFGVAKEYILPMLIRT